MRIYEDLRALQSRLSVLQTVVVGDRWPSWSSTSGTCRWCGAVLPRPGGEQPHPGGAHRRAARAALRPQRPGARGEPPLLQRRAHRRSTAHDLDAELVRLAGAPRRSDEDQIRERLAAAGPALPAGRGEGRRQRARTWPPSRRAGSSCPRSRSRWCRCAPTRSAAAAAHVLGRVGEVTDRQLAAPRASPASSRGRRGPGRASSRSTTARSWARTACAA